ncbi:DNA cytosine methyltransferase [Mangrovibacterium sp.]|uniref:DNA cytosine methyltransferase n=1 Tax=Mangrovibacterium sp. TaxID=1961364 RepID=UPI00356906D0
MLIKYSDIRKKLEFERKKELDDLLAGFTHYLQSPAEYSRDNYYKPFEEQLNGSKLNKVEETALKLPLKWDVPFPPPENPKFTFIDLFAGIGGFRIALQKQDGKCVFSSEIDKAAKQTYEMNFGEIPFGDIRKFTGPDISDDLLDKLIPNHDLLAAGFPCQPFSLAGVSARNFLGKEHGFNDSNQGNLFFDILRIVDVKRPKAVFLENVKNLRSHDKGRTFETIKTMIKELGYSFSSEVVNSQTRVPQRRQRTYMVCFRDATINYKFPSFEGEPIPLRSILENSVDEKYTISDRLWQGHKNRSKRNLERGTGFSTKEADLDKPSNTIVARYYKDGKECLIPQPGKNPRKLTPRECARLQGYPESFIYHKSNSSAYKQFGNSVSVPVIERIAESITKYL